MIQDDPPLTGPVEEIVIVAIAGRAVSEHHDGHDRRVTDESTQLRNLM
jgi:hypothetical protein